MTIPRQNDANPRDSALSPGLTPPRGRQPSAKAPSREGGTAAKFADLDDSAITATRLQEWDRDLNPEDPAQVFLARQAIAASVRLDRCAAAENAWLTAQFARFEARAWEADRRAGVARLAAGLARRPGVVAAKLRQTLHGCEWLAEQWLVLDATLGKGNPPATPLSEKDRRRACDLLGLSADRRQVPTPLDLPIGSEASLAAHQAEVIWDQIDELEQLQAKTLAEADELEREAERSMLVISDDPALRLIRRYEAEAERDYRKAMDTLRQLKGKSRR